MERNPAARAYEEIMKRVSENENEPVNTGGFLKRPVENSSIDANDVAGRAAHYFSQIHNERKKFNEDRKKMFTVDEKDNPIQYEPDRRDKALIGESFTEDDLRLLKGED